MTMLPPDPIYIFKEEMGPVFCLTFRKAIKVITLYAGTQCGMVHAWDLKTNRQIGTFESSKESCISIHALCESPEIITQDRMGTIRFWTEQNTEWQLLKEITSGYYGFCRFTLHQDILYIPLKNGSLESLDIRTKEKLSLYNLVENGVNEIMCFKIFDMNEETLAIIAFESCDVSLYSFKEKKILSSFKVDECPMALDYDVSKKKGVCGCPTEKVSVFTVNKNYELLFKRNIILINPGVASLAIRPDGKIIAIGCWDGKLRLYSMKTLSILAVLDIHSYTVQDVLFTNVEDQEGKNVFYLAAASKDCKISLWDLYNK